jgi:hypothetical protein
MPTFTIVFIPEDLRRPVEEREVSYDENTIVSCLMDYAKAHFRTVKPKDEQAAREAYIDQVLSHAKAKGLALPTGDDKDLMLDKLSDMQMVDTVAVQLNLPETNWKAVYLYVDDRGQAKRLEVNQRASQFLLAAGLTDGVLGDAFVACARDDNNDLYERLDFTLADLSSDAPWVAVARLINQRRAEANARSSDGRGGGGATTLLLPNAPPAPPKYSGMSDEERVTAARQLKDKGNDAFKAGSLDDAYAAYTDAIEALSGIPMVAWSFSRGDGVGGGGGAGGAGAGAGGGGDGGSEEAAGAGGSEEAAGAAASAAVGGVGGSSVTAAATSVVVEPMGNSVEAMRVDLQCNAAFVRLKQERWEDASTHATRALNVDANNVKALYRRGE